MRVKTAHPYGSKKGGGGDTQKRMSITESLSSAYVKVFVSSSAILTLFETST
jgi:hypothetical protein